eukprot:GHVT01049524.1.p1 GENE.GHVT01049524.1~~GHVT01049524.1.p1  ORF type:complete len:247 (-),score=14.70 GHVT01049524.1:1181-1921(-)
MEQHMPDCYRDPLGGSWSIAGRPVPCRSVELPSRCFCGHTLRDHSPSRVCFSKPSVGVVPLRAPREPAQTAVVPWTAPARSAQPVASRQGRSCRIGGRVGLRHSGSDVAPEVVTKSLELSEAPKGGPTQSNSDPATGPRCRYLGCKCSAFNYFPLQGSGELRCKACKHSHRDHQPNAPRRCAICRGGCAGFCSSWRCPECEELVEKHSTRLRGPMKKLEQPAPWKSDEPRTDVSGLLLTPHKYRRH